MKDNVCCSSRVGARGVRSVWCCGGSGGRMCVGGCGGCCVVMKRKQGRGSSEGIMVWWRCSGGAEGMS